MGLAGSVECREGAGEAAEQSRAGNPNEKKRERVTEVAKQSERDTHTQPASEREAGDE